MRYQRNFNIKDYFIKDIGALKKKSEKIMQHISKRLI